MLQRLRDNLTYYLFTHVISHIIFFASLGVLIVFYPELENVYLKLSFGVIPAYIFINAVFFVLRKNLTDEQKEDLHRLLSNMMH